MVALIITKSNNSIVDNGIIIEDIKDEQGDYNKLTINNTVIMDKETFDKIKYPLPNRLNLVISNTHNYKGNNIITVHSLEQALYLATDNAFIIGNNKLLKEALSQVNKIYITDLNLEIKDDSILFPDLNEKEFNKKLIKENKSYKKYVYTRK